MIERLKPGSSNFFFIDVGAGGNIYISILQIFHILIVRFQKSHCLPGIDKEEHWREVYMPFFNKFERSLAMFTIKNLSSC